MPLYTSARVFDRYSNARTRGFNGYASSTDSVGVTDYSGILLNSEVQIPLLGTGTSFTTVPFPERLSASARYGDRVTYSATIIGYKDSSFSIATNTDLGAVQIHCGNEFNWNVSLSYDGPACGKLRVSGISGSLTIYQAGSAPTQSWAYFPGTAPSGTVSEDGVDYSDTEGERYYTTWEVMGMSGIPWSDWVDIPV
jgi:hypothetical protein